MECPDQPQITLKSNCCSVNSGNVTRRIPLGKKKSIQNYRIHYRHGWFGTFLAQLLLMNFSFQSPIFLQWQYTAAGLGQKASFTWTLPVCSWTSGDVLSAHFCLLLQNSPGNMESDWKLLMEMQSQNCPRPRLLQTFPIDSPLVLDWLSQRLSIMIHLYPPLLRERL